MQRSRCSRLWPDRNLHADARLILRHNGVVETGHIDALVLQASGVVLREFRIIEHHRADGALGRFDVEAGFHHLRTEVFHVLHEAVVNFVAFIENLEGLDTGTHHRGRNGVGEEIGDGCAGGACR